MRSVAVPVAAVLVFTAVLLACGPDGGPAFLSDSNGGATTAKLLRGRPVNQAARNLSLPDQQRFARGADVFDRAFEPHRLRPDAQGKGCLSCHQDGTRRVAPFPPSAPLGFVDHDGSARTADPLVGLGLLGSIPDASLKEAARTQARAGEVSGRVSIVDGEIGRFGWRAEQPTVESQIRRALNHELGLTLSDPEFADLVFYTETIAVPRSRDASSPAVQRGARTFEKVGCASCHTPTQRSGPSSNAALANQTFHPYTDLLLHDMGPRLADVGGAEWRTPPLWGLGRRRDVEGEWRLLHDGRAQSIDLAVQLHGGEAAEASNRYGGLQKNERDDLLAFLNGL